MTPHNTSSFIKQILAWISFNKNPNLHFLRPKKGHLLILSFPFCESLIWVAIRKPYQPSKDYQPRSFSLWMNFSSANRRPLIDCLLLNFQTLKKSEHPLKHIFRLFFESSTNFSSIKLTNLFFEVCPRGRGLRIEPFILDTVFPRWSSWLSMFLGLKFILGLAW